MKKKPKVKRSIRLGLDLYDTVLIYAKEHCAGVEAHAYEALLAKGLAFDGTVEGLKKAVQQLKDELEEARNRPVDLDGKTQNQIAKRTADILRQGGGLQIGDYEG